MINTGKFKIRSEAGNLLPVGEFNKKELPKDADIAYLKSIGAIEDSPAKKESEQLPPKV